MAAKKFLMPFAIMIGASACSEDHANNYDDTGYSSSHTGTGTTDVATKTRSLNQEELIRVCRVGHGFRVGRNPEDMTASVEGGIVSLAYSRDDGKSFRYDCRVEGNVIRTRMIDEAGPGTGPGHWSGRGSTTTFGIEDASITVRDVFSDGSIDEETYDFER